MRTVHAKGLNSVIWGYVVVCYVILVGLTVVRFKLPGVTETMIFTAGPAAASWFADYEEQAFRRLQGLGERPPEE